MCSRYAVGSGSQVAHGATASGFKLTLKRGVPTPCPDCTDGARNGTETDVDCGGGACPAVRRRAAPAAPAPTARRSVCVGGVCQPPRCSDGVKNGSETDVDCGGELSPRCADRPGLRHRRATARAASARATSAQAATCSDGVKNGHETDIDCGGGLRATAPPARRARAAPTAQSGVCTGGVCQAASCARRRQERDRDRHRLRRRTCPDVRERPGMRRAGATARAASAPAASARPPRCVDGVKNGDETDVDCGGAACATVRQRRRLRRRAATARAASAPATSARRRRAATASRTAPRPTSTAAAACPALRDGQGCVAPTRLHERRLHRRASARRRPAPTASRTAPRPTSTAAARPARTAPTGEQLQRRRRLRERRLRRRHVPGGDAAPTASRTAPRPASTAAAPSCADVRRRSRMRHWAATATSGVCTGGVCQTPACTDGVKNGSETDVDCGGGSCPGCGTGRRLRRPGRLRRAASASAASARRRPAATA